ncbi:MAG: SpaA isopeptide-forming pilin-related protein, partial [Defluviitaleaceae bacterium]|nr:SpaA isopeptide-forming pilin-related protein [Defluviitaleaceae bacterium]
VFRNVVLQRSATVAQGTPATPPAALAPSSQSGTSRGGGVTIEPAEGGGGHFVLCRGGEIRNSTTDNNGPIDIQTSGRFTMMQGSALYDNAAGNSGGAVHVNTNANFTMNGGVIHNNTARGENTANPLARAVGGAVFIQNGGTFDMYGGEIFANSASLSTIAAIPSVTNAIVTSCGGAVFVTGATSSFNMHGGTIRDNNATRTRASDTAAANRFLFRSGNGGGVYATEGATFTMQGGVIQNNIATTSGVVTVNNALNVANGGGVYITGAGTTFRMAGGFILGNQALRTLSSVPITLLTALHIYAGNGGGVHAFDGATFNMESGTISNNIAHATGATPAFNINGTTSLSNGGGVFIAGDGTTMNMSGGQIEGNSASGSVAASSSISGNGGGVHIAAGARLNMSNGTISNNSALNLNSPATPRGNGAGVYVSGSSSTFDMSGGGIQNHNNVTRHGVGLFLTDGALVNISNNAQISNNNSPDNGGGVYLEFSGMVNMSGGTISGNTAALNGGGVFLNGTSGGAFEMYGGTIGGSNTAQHGGGVAIETGDFFVLDPSATIAHNQAYLGGGVYVSIGGRFSGQDGSIANNHAIANGGGLFSEFYLNEDTLPIFAYLNLHTSDRFIFSGNTASVASRPPYNYNELFHMQSASSSIPNSHILNNFDINFFLEPLVPTFTFTKTDTSLNPLSGAVFDLDGQVQTSDGDGQISFELTLGREYRLEEISPPPGHMPSLGHWAISANGFSPSDITITPSDGAREFAFRDGVWYVDNEIEIFPIPFYLHKTDNQLYSLESFENVGHILLAGATFELHRYTAPDQWQLISTATSTADISQPMVFELIAGEVYRLVETQAPAGFTTPKGQWQITPQDNGADAPPTFTIVAMGDTLLPAFAQIGDYFYVGNRPQLTLPLTGGSGASAFLALGGLVLILLSLAITWRYIISKKLRRQYYEK